MAQKIAGVEPGSLAEQLGIAANDTLLSINGEEVLDYIDYQALTSGEETTVVVARAGEEIEYVFSKDEYEPLGLVFATDLLTPMRMCRNHCLFCFVDQLPKDVRPSMRVKDDDWRMSLLMGSYVTLTNVDETEFARILKRRASPLYISVHATDDELRCRLLGTAAGAGLLERLRRMAEAELQFHAQAVLCPGLNDGAALNKTIADLAALYPAAQSLALVPVGLTGHRQGLTPLRPYDAESAGRVLDELAVWQEKFRRELGTAFVFAADEFYLLAGRPFPGEDEYEDYPQIENGVGLCRQLAEEYAYAYRGANLSQAKKRRLVVATGTSAAGFLAALFEKYRLPKVDIEVRALTNTYFGESVTVAGLLTGGDLIRQLKGVRADKILLTECMLREGEDVFLDGVTPNEVVSALGVEIEIVPRGGEALLDAVMGIGG